MTALIIGLSLNVIDVIIYVLLIVKQTNMIVVGLSSGVIVTLGGVTVLFIAARGIMEKFLGTKPK